MINFVIWPPYNYHSQNGIIKAWGFKTVLFEGGSPPGESDPGYYSMVMACCLPATMLSSRLTTFFASQKITGPSSQTTPLALLLILALFFFDGFGYEEIKFHQDLETGVTRGISVWRLDVDSIWQSQS